jgi:hypothetical protein
MRASLVLAVAVLLSTTVSAQVERLDSGYEPLASDFQKSKGRARLIAILSPT